MLYAVLKIAVECIYKALMLSKRFKGYGVYKLRGVLSHENVHVCVELCKLARAVCHFVGGDAACNGYNYGLSC